ncbi:hypothetical protein DY000_02034113 [Brassica cretica]|uniref:Uncharacterized protein n=1 Tax=Brassica cretica TaxID=69181 RepID=A0ABQ7DIR9_BRACR|nr:hypothetical protein DY000_02034113 [Brassica cretica]
MAATKMFFHHMVLIFHSFKDAGFSDPDLDMQVFQTWKTSRQEVFQTTSRKTSRKSSPMSPFHNRSERCDLCLIYMFFRSGSYFERPMGNLLRSLLKYNALEDFLTSRKSSRRLQRSFPDDQTTYMKSSDGVIFHIKWSLSLSL